MVRLGIGLHGISATHANLQPVSSFKTYISSIREVPEGQSIGYGRKSYTTRPSRIAVIPVGYADGLNRHLSNRVVTFIKGKRVPIIGNICMDTCMIDVTDTNAAIGDEVEIFGNISSSPNYRSNWEPSRTKFSGHLSPRKTSILQRMK
ncbi:MAG: alanine racemase [Butyricimonas faecihominis]